MIIFCTAVIHECVLMFFRHYRQWLLKLKIFHHLRYGFFLFKYCLDKHLLASLKVASNNTNSYRLITFGHMLWNMSIENRKITRWTRSNYVVKKMKFRRKILCTILYLYDFLNTENYPGIIWWAFLCTRANISASYLRPGQEISHHDHTQRKE